MKEAQRRDTLREQLHPIVVAWFGGQLADIALDALTESVTDAVHPVVRAAYENGKNNAQAREGRRLVQENERLRRELEQSKKGLT